MIEEERLSITFGAPVPKEHLTFRNSLYGGPSIMRALIPHTGWMDCMWTRDTLFVVFLSPG
jgi:hypothetical protein